MATALLFIGSTVPSAHAGSQAAESLGSAPPGDLHAEEESGVLPRPEDLQADLALVAEANGWTIEQANERYRLSQELGRIQEEISSSRRARYVGGELGRNPGDPATLYVKGPADEFFSELVGSSTFDIVLADNQPFSFDELEARKLRVHRALEDMGMAE